MNIKQLHYFHELAQHKHFAKAAKAQGFPIFDTANLRHYTEELKNGAFAIGAPTDHVEAVTGTPAESFEQTTRRYFADITLIAPSMGPLSLPGALSFMVKMMLTRAPDYDAFDRARFVPQITDPLLAHQNPQWVADAKAQQLHLLET